MSSRSADKSVPAGQAGSGPVFHAQEEVLKNMQILGLPGLDGGSYRNLKVLASWSEFCGQYVLKTPLFGYLLFVLSELLR